MCILLILKGCREKGRFFQHEERDGGVGGKCVSKYLSLGNSVCGLVCCVLQLVEDKAEGLLGLVLEHLTDDAIEEHGNLVLAEVVLLDVGHLAVGVRRCVGRWVLLSCYRFKACVCS